MRFQKQAFRHKPEEGMFGDCHRTCIAMMLGLDRDEVPNFGEHYGCNERFHEAIDEYLKEHGLKQVDVAFDCDFDTFMNNTAIICPNMYVTIGGNSKNGCGHSVIALRGKIVWDPSLDDSGIVGPMEGGYYWLTMLVPRKFFVGEI